MPLMPYKDYWFDKLKAYRDAGELVRSGVKCPQDANELWVLGKPQSGLSKSGNKVELVTNFAICRDGHRHDL